MKDSRHQNWQSAASEERGECSSVGDKSEGKRPVFGTYGSGGRPPVINGGNQTTSNGSRVVQIGNGGRSGG